MSTALTVKSETIDLSTFNSLSQIRTHLRAVMGLSGKELKEYVNQAARQYHTAANMAIAGRTSQGYTITSVKTSKSGIITVKHTPPKAVAETAKAKLDKAEQEIARLKAALAEATKSMPGGTVCPQCPETTLNLHR